MRYEYKIVQLKEVTLLKKNSAVEQLNVLGCDGWEVIAVTPSRSIWYGGDKVGEWVYTLKRCIEWIN